MLWPFTSVEGCSVFLVCTGFYKDFLSRILHRCYRVVESVRGFTCIGFSEGVLRLYMGAIQCYKGLELALKNLLET